VLEDRRSPAAAAIARLTPRERDVLLALAEGGTNKEIALALSISPGTVKTHVERLIGKLGVRDRTQAAILAVEYRLGLAA
jgi:DNA-binding NarL/FixJ family response regulator